MDRSSNNAGETCSRCFSREHDTAPSLTVTLTSTRRSIRTSSSSTGLLYPGMRDFSDFSARGILRVNVGAGVRPLTADRLECERGVLIARQNIPGNFAVRSPSTAARTWQQTGLREGFHGIYQHIGEKQCPTWALRIHRISFWWARVLRVHGTNDSVILSYRVGWSELRNDVSRTCQVIRRHFGVTQVSVRVPLGRSGRYHRGVRKEYISWGMLDNRP